MANAEQTFPNWPNPPHVVTATGPNGVTPGFWDATNPDSVGVWETVDHESGTADRTGKVVQEFPDTGKWKQT